MSEVIHVEAHSSPIKTPTQLIVVVVLSFVVPIALIAMLAHLATRGGDFGKGNPAMSDEASFKEPADQPAPAAKPESGTKPAAAGAPAGKAPTK